jgi:hypothetical protein
MKREVCFQTNEFNGVISVVFVITEVDISTRNTIVVKVLYLFPYCPNTKMTMETGRSTKALSISFLFKLIRS